VELPLLAAPLIALARELGRPLLALDTSVRLGSLALATDDGLWEQTLATSSLPSESLVTCIGDTLAAAGAIARELGAIVVGLGPGSFTGLRVALATVKGLAYGSGAAVYGVSSLALLAAGAGTGIVAPLVDARRGELFCALYEVREDGLVRTLIEDGARTPGEFAALLAGAGPPDRFVADVPTAFEKLIEFAGRLAVQAPEPRAAAGLLLAADRLRASDAEDLTSLCPRYLRLSEAERLARRAGEA
jgi:tRNA threonylcarbamoyladenosine biosynthesis protein TsaB